MSPSSRLLATAMANPRTALMLLAVLGAALGWSDAHAALPTVDLPEGIDGQQVSQGDWLGAMGGYFKKGVTILGLIMAAWGFLMVVSGAFTKWRAYSKGQAEFADLKEYMITGAIFTVFLILMVTYAFEVFS
ncbi:DUF2976 domain-containing protein [Corticibacter populi]|uniref:DUF2976 domain-containing protein n=1 Tax=Corticibacter populi TaxID=1550736 RepID=A0A3M6R027_9BURK|nr:DUF2976 domain-containing protein [Corticibacter populi]RMX08142.1 DUF2976 domain-containing protein [Corticibacter populi]RZS35398.1 integrating conjugative element membrane protein (TIGR03745 family) [Corticibacter populi]